MCYDPVLSQVESTLSQQHGEEEEQDDETAKYGMTIFWGPAPNLSSFFTLHDHRVTAKCLHECFAHRSMLLESV